MIDTITSLLKRLQADSDNKELEEKKILKNLMT